jgi:hypothetical protein
LRKRREAALARSDARDSSAGIALALVRPFVGIARAGAGKKHVKAAALSQPGDGQGTGSMTRKPSIKSLETVSFDEAVAYLEHARGDELDAAYALALDRNRLDGSHGLPDDPEVHHALFLLCRARGQDPPSYDAMRVELRRRVAA